MSKTAIALILALPVCLCSCRNLNVPEAAPTARAEIVHSNGGIVGAATLSETTEGVSINLSVVNLPPGEHGFHIHENGECVPPGFETAGGHLALPGQKHGFEVEGGPHLGDLRNLEIPENGKATVQRTVEGANLSGQGSRSLLDRAIVIHARPDDYESQPSGAAGARIACGVIAESISPVLTENPMT